ncbi:MAG: dTDP-4-amino-4,6-dideoxygalactose transaminase, partial [Pseudomonadota bacterium]
NHINTPFHYVPLHSSPAGAKYGHSFGDLLVTNHISDTLVRLPMYFDLGSDIETVIEVVQSFFRKTRYGKS